MPARNLPGRASTSLFVVAAVFTFASVALGSIVCATDSSAACPNWPGCYVGQVAPKGHLNPILEFVHRVVAVTTGPLLLACCVVGFRSRDGMVRVLPWLGLVGALVAGVLGMLTVKRGISKVLAAFDLGWSLAALVAITVAAVCVLRAPRCLVWTLPGRMAWLAVAAWWVTHVVSIFVAGKGSLTRCVSWPIWRILDVDGNHGLQWVRLLLGGLAVALTFATVAMAARRRDTRVFALAVGVLAIAELVMGHTVIASGAGLVAKGTYAATAGAILCGLTWIAALSTVEPQR